MNRSFVKVCRLCLKLLFKEKYFDINYVEPSSGFMPFRDQITTCMPELALDVLPECYICFNCADFLKAAYEFKNSCLKVEDKIRNYFENLSTDTNFDPLSLSKYVRQEESIEEDEIKPEEEIESNPIRPSIDIELLTREENFGVESSDEKYVPKVTVKGIFPCSMCRECFKTTKELVKHKKTTHCATYICNFCNKQFRSLLFLRQHNTLCKEKAANVSEVPWSNTSQKRPHLPATAKNHLTEWLFHHQQHPYPTDFEKQRLMKETNLTLVQVENWFINARRRVLLDFSRGKKYMNKVKQRNEKTLLSS